MTTAQQGPAGQDPEPVYEHIDALQLAFDRVKRLEAAGQDDRQTVSAHAYWMAALWVGLAIALEVRRVLKELRARL